MVTSPSPEDDSWVGRTVGRFRLIRLLGQGGMSQVYLGERADDFRQIAAVKLTCEGLQDAAALSRFHAEQKTLSTLQHPNIVHLIDSGVTGDGTPFLAMDYVEGVPLDQFCDSQRLSCRVRMEIMIQVLDALEYAHQRSIAHCDLKFSNVLVTADRKPHLLDFGLTTQLAQGGFPREEPTAGAAWGPFTFEFASPEQLQGQSLTTATDIYSAGVMLYVLLAGAHPFQSVRDQPLALWRAVIANEPKPPSSHLKNDAERDPSATARACAARGTTLRRLRRELRGDVEAILLKALRKEPEQRYASAADFMADLRNLLGRRPATARQGSTRYRVWKFARRNRVMASAAVVLVGILLAATVGTISQAVRAERSRTVARARFEEVGRLTRSLLEEFYTEVRGLDGSEQARQSLVRWSGETLESLARQASASAAERVELADTYLRLGQLLTGGDQRAPQYAEAISAFDHGLALLEPVLQKTPANPAARAEALRLHEARAQIEQKAGNLPESRREAERGRGLRSGAPSARGHTKP